MKFKICDWERNGYSDSDWFCAVWDTETCTMHEESEGTTRFPGGYQRKPYPPLHSNPEALAQWREWAMNKAALMIRGEQILAYSEPRMVAKGETLITTRECKHRGKPSTPKGTEGRVFWVGSFGKFYRNGYNKPGRHNTRVGLELIDGEKTFVPLSACRLAKEPETLEAIKARLAQSHLNPMPLTSCTAWLSGDYTS